MKILSIHFQNLNSLEGEWQIDFTAPAYQNNSLFAITGPTGSGKTTLLDAICLALYGQTPRLKVISKSVNEILTRQTGVCFSEIIFETLEGLYRCHWSQHRARKQPDGELQQPRHEIVDHSNDQILENKIKDVALKVEQVTGMNFEQFTRSILLAQGSFSAFLLAPPDDRAPILEKITGTEVYTRISQQVYKRTVQEESNYKILLEQIENLAIISQEEEAELQQRLKEKHQHSTNLAKDIAKIQTFLQWHKSVTTLEDEVKKLTEEKASLTQIFEKSLPEKKLLAKARAALSIEPAYQHMKSQIDEQSKERDLLIQKNKEKADCEVAVGQLSLKNVECSSEIQKIDSKIEKEKATIKRVREIDLHVLELRKNHDQKQETVALTTIKRDEKQKLISNSSNELTILKNELESCQKYLNLHKNDEKLREYLGVFNTTCKHYKDLCNKKDNIINNLAPNCEKKNNLLTSIQQIQEDQDKATTELKNAEENLGQLSRESGRINAEFPHLRKQLEKNTAELALYEKLYGLIEQKTQFEKRQQQTLKEITKLNASLLERKEKKKNLEKEIAAQEKVFKKQLDIVVLSKKILSFEEERSRLKKGEPCPLCGSMEHPFASDHPPIEDSAESTLNEERELLDSLKNELLTMNTGILIDQKRQSDAEAISTDLHEQLRILHEDQKRLCVQLDIDPGTIVFDNIRNSIAELENHQEILNQTTEALENTQKKISIIRNDIDTSRHTVLNHERLLVKAENEAANLNEKITQQKQELLEHESNILSLLTELGGELQFYGVNEVTEDTLATLPQQLSTRSQKWHEMHEVAQKLMHQCSKLEIELSKEQEFFTDLQEELKNLTRQEAAAKKEVHMKMQERHAVYGKKDPDEEEQKANEERVATVSRLREIEKQFSSTSEKLAVIKEQQRQLQLSISKRELVIKETEKKFTDLLSKNDFHDEKEFLQVKLTEEEINEKEHRFAQLDKNIDKVTNLLDEKQCSLDQEKMKDLCPEEPPILEKKLVEKEQQQKEHYQEIGRIEGKLADNINLLKQQKEKQEKLAGHKKELLKWQQLNNLIGSASGKKFCHFAQGITFEIMVQHANRNLQRMTDRYILRRDPIQPLELDIIDNYRAGVVRSTKNLSGGESFLVSLALALGLSNMASKNIKVDSLFLDEGFGTLDEETLETAIQTLAGLQQEGKIIGIISHVATLKERISTQIEVVAGRRGRSTLKGPGVRAI